MRILLIDIPSVPYRAPAEDIALNKRISDADAIWEARFGLANSVRKHMHPYSNGLLSIATVLRQAGATLHYAAYDQLHHKPVRSWLQHTDFAAISTISPFLPVVRRIAEFLHTEFPAISLIVGGHGPTHEPEAFLRACPQPAACVVGEGEQAVWDAITYLQNGKIGHGICVQSGDTIRQAPRHEPLLSENIPTVDYSILPEPLERYRLNISTIRGCPANCYFCAGARFWRKLRCRPVDRVVEELRFLNAQLPTGYLLHFCDNVISYPKQRFLELSERMAEEKFHLNFSCDIRANHVDQEIALALERAGFKRICLGVEDANDGVLLKNNKRLSLKDNLDTLTLLRQNTQAFLLAYWMVGLPGTTPKTIRHNISTIRDLILNQVVDAVSPSLFKPYPGCAVLEHREIALVRDWDEFLADMSVPMYRLPTLSAEQLAQAVRTYKLTVIEAYVERSTSSGQSD